MKNKKLTSLDGVSRPLVRSTSDTGYPDEYTLPDARVHPPKSIQCRISERAYKIRTEFKMHSIATPVSAKTAIHIFAIPAKPSNITAALINNANTTFCFAIRPVSLAMDTACGIALIAEFINTTSAASIAASAPLPMAAPTSAPANTGASLIPSPTNRSEERRVGKEC